MKDTDWKLLKANHKVSVCVNLKLQDFMFRCSFYFSLTLTGTCIKPLSGWWSVGLDPPDPSSQQQLQERTASSKLKDELTCTGKLSTDFLWHTVWCKWCLPSSPSLSVLLVVVLTFCPVFVLVQVSGGVPPLRSLCQRALRSPEHLHLDAEACFSKGCGLQLLSLWVFLFTVASLI